MLLADFHKHSRLYHVLMPEKPVNGPNRYSLALVGFNQPDNGLQPFPLIYPQGGAGRSPFAVFPLVLNLDDYALIKPSKFMAVLNQPYCLQVVRLFVFYGCIFRALPGIDNK